MLKEKKQKVKKNSKIKTGNKLKSAKADLKVLETSAGSLVVPAVLEIPVVEKESTPTPSFEEKPTLVNFTDLISNQSYKFVVPVTVFIFVLIVASFVFVNSRGKAKALPVVAGVVTTSPAESARLNAVNLIAQVSKVILLPTNEDPTIETVADLNLLKGQAFFSSAKVGDKVLVYLKNGKAYLFRPDENKIIEVGTFEPVVTSNSQSIKTKKTSSIKK